MLTGMSRQITIRLPDELTDFVDAGVAARHYASRAALVAAALECYRERAVGGAILAGYTAVPDGEDEDLDGFLSAASKSL